jgi:hypothetical protein
VTTQTRDLDWREIVQRSWGKEYTAPETAYEFTGHKFVDRTTQFEGISLDTGSLYADNYADSYA